MKMNQNPNQDASHKMMALMREATALLQKNGAGAATEKIQQTLADMMPAQSWPDRRPAMRDLNDAPGASGVHKAPAAQRMPANFVPDLLARLGVALPLPAHMALDPNTDLLSSFGHGQSGEILEAEEGAAGQFLTRSFTNHAGTRACKLYVPTGYHGQALPLVVMLHGCKQHPDDFAAGTGFNVLAEETPCLVLYPAQAQSANISACWNWFGALDQQRGQGEPALIAGMTQQVVEEYGLDPGRVFIAGLSAGGAMAAIMGRTYPELYSAIGVHSGLPHGAAHDLPSALAAMKHGAAVTGRCAVAAPPVIVFHGERDPTVHPRNADQIVAQAGVQNAVGDVSKGRADGGRSYTRTVYRDGDANVVAEQWLVHGAGHAWSGGSARGSYTDRKGPDASREMMRFFAASPARAAD